MTYKKLLVIDKGIELAVDIYNTTNTFPKSEVFGLTNQMRRAAVSVASNISEGSYREGKDFLYFIRIAKGSTAELITQISIAEKLGYININISDSLRNKSTAIIKMLHGLSKSIKLTTNN